MIIVVNDNSNSRQERNDIECEQLSFPKAIIPLNIVNCVYSNSLCYIYNLLKNKPYLNQLKFDKVYSANDTNGPYYSEILVLICNNC